MKDEQKPTLILGGTGKTGRRVADRLKARGLPVRVASRSGAPPFEWADQNTWAPALEGVGSLYVAYHPDLAVPAAAAHVRALSALAVESGVRKIVLLSGRGEPHVVPSERAVRESGAAYTIVRCSWFNQNFSEGHLLDPVREGVLAFPAGSVSEPFVDVDDIADVAAAALADDAHAGQTYELSGPRLITFAEAVGEIARATGRDIRYVPVTPQEYEAGLAQYVPAEDAKFLAELFRYILDGHNSHLSDGVERALGRRPRDFSDYVRATAATGVWGA
jgi:uncharacterized protein YbjT (DUF2867 family)